MTPARRSTLAFRAAVALFAAVFIAVHVVRIVEPLGVDQGLFACFARWVPRGWLPYRDIFDSKPPLFLYWYGLSAAIPGDVVRAMWWLEGGWLAVTFGLAYALGARVWGRWAGLATAALLFAGLWSPAWGGFWSRAQAEELLTLPMIGAAWMAWSARERARLALWAGVLTGVCGLFKIPSMAIAGAWAVTWLATMPLSAASRRVALMVAGIAAPWALAVVWFAAHGALGSFVEGVFVYHRYNAAFIAPPWSNVLEDFTFEMLTKALLPLAAAAIGVARMVHRRSRDAWWIGAWIAFTMAAIVLQRQLAGYHYLLAAAGLAFAGGHGLAELGALAARASGRTRGLAYAALALLAALAARDAASWGRAYEPDAAHLAGRLPRDAYLRRVQQGSYAMVTEEQAARYVREHTSPGDGILVWGLSPGIYALADRHPVTRFPFHKLLMTNAPLSRMWPGLDDRRARFMERLRADPPVYVLVGRGDANGFEPEESLSSMMRFRELSDLVKRDYLVETQIGRFLVYRRTTAPP